MSEVTKAQFEAFVAGVVTQSEPQIEQDGEFSYKNWLNLDGEEIAFISYRDGELLAYHIVA